MKPVSAAAQSVLWAPGEGKARERFVRWPFGFAMAVRPVIFLPRMAGEWDEVSGQAILAHERIHHRQQRALGLRRFALAYYLNRRLRWRIERAGYRREIAVYLKNDRRPDAAGYAQSLSSRFYGGMVRYEEALAWCQRTIGRLDQKRNGPYTWGV